MAFLPRPAPTWRGVLPEKSQLLKLASACGEENTCTLSLELQRIQISSVQRSCSKGICLTITVQALAVQHSMSESQNEHRTEQEKEPILQWPYTDKT